MNYKGLYKKGFWTLVHRTIGAVFTFVSTLYFARLLGAAEFGLFSLGLTIVSITSVIARAGIDNVVLKQVAAHQPDESEVVNGYIYYSMLLVAIIGLFISLMLWSLSDVLSNYLFSKPQLDEVLRAFSLVIIPMSLVFIFSEINKALGLPEYSAFFQTVFPPAVTLGIVVVLSSSQKITLSILIGGVSIGYISSTLVFLIGLKKHLFKARKTQIRYWYLLKQSFPMLLVSSGALVMAWSDTIILGIYSAATDVGIYSAASRTVMVTVLILIAVNSVTAPRYARLYKEGDIKGIAVLAQNSSAILFFSVLFPTTILLFYPDWVMHWFGTGYVAGSSILKVLAIGQFVNVTCGPVGCLLMMTGKENKFRNILFLTAVINIILSIFLVKKLGVIGVAYGTAFSVTLWNVLATWEVRRHLGFWTVLPKFTISER